MKNKPEQLTLNLATEINQLHDELAGLARTSLTKAIEIGELLTRQKAALQHGEWLPWCAENLEFSDRQASRYLKIYSNRTALSDLETPEEAYRLLSQSGEEQEDGSRPHVSRNSGENEWYTPPEFIEAAREAMGSIDVDPASNPIANEKVGATVFFTAEDSGLEKEWVGNIWMNPPYAQPLISQFSVKFLEEMVRAPERAGIVLVNNATETEWFQRMFFAAEAACFPRGRIKFWQPETDSASPLQGQAILYFGGERHLFYNAFVGFGPVLWKP